MEVTGEPSQQIESVDVQRMLLVAYSQIGEPDSLHHGACSTHIMDYICGSEGVGREGLIEYQYEAAYRCGQWDEGGGASLVNPAMCCGYHQTMRSCLTSLRDGKTELLNSSIAEAR